MTLHELERRLGEATGPSRELDAEIWLLVTPGATRKATPVNHPKGAYVIDETREASGRLIIIPSYTSSLDAALTLVPEGYKWQVSNRAVSPHTGRAWINNGELQLAGVGGMSRNPKYRGHETTAATAPIALCIAALRARTQEHGE